MCEGKATLVLRGRSARVEGLVFTHMQVAQPITFAHHVLAYVEMFSRDVERLDGLLHVSQPRLEPRAPVLVPVALRPDPDAPEDPSGKLRYGLTEWQDLDLYTAMEMVADRVVKARNDTWQDIDDDGRKVRFAKRSGEVIDR